MASTSKSTQTVPLGIGLGILAGILVYGHAIGLGLAAYVLIWVMTLLIHVRSSGARIVYRNLTLIIPILFFAGMVVLRADQSLQLLSILAGTFAMFLMTYFLTSGNIANQGLGEYLVKIAIGAVDMFFLPMQELSTFTTSSERRHRIWRRLMTAAQILLLLFVVVAVLFIWFMYANADFRQTVSQTINPFWLGRLPELFFLINFVIIASWLSIGILASALSTREVPKTAVRKTVFDSLPMERPSTPIPAEGVRYRRGMQILLVICLFCGWILLSQSPRLLAGRIEVKAWGYQQFTSLAVIALAIIYYLNQRVVRETPRQIALFKGLSSVAIVLNVGILAEAFQDLSLNAAAGNSDWSQVAVYALIPWLAIVLVGQLVSLHWQWPAMNVSALVILLSVFGAVATLDLLNPELIIGWQKVTGDNVSVSYLEQIPVEAVPAMVSLVDAPRDAQRILVRGALRQLRAQLAPFRESDWRAYNIGRSNALTLLDQVQDKLTE